MPEPLIELRLTRSQQMALIDLLLDYMEKSDQIQAFVDVTRDVTTTAGELLSLVAEAHA